MKEKYLELLKLVKENEHKKKENEKKEKRLSDYWRDKSFIEFEIEKTEEEIEELRRNIKESNIFLKIRYKKLNDVNRKEIEEKEKKVKALQNKISQLEKQKDEDLKLYKTIPVIFKEKNGILYIDEKDCEKVQTTKNIEGKEEILVHATNYFNFDGKILTSASGGKHDSSYNEIYYRGVYKIVPAISKRNTIHFIKNNVVSDHMAGTFGNFFIILEPEKYHHNEIVSGDASDTWTRGDMILSDDAIIMVSSDKIDSIPQEAKEKYNIIVYNGKRESCVSSVLRVFGYEVFHVDMGCATHAKSIDIKLETCLKVRNQLLNIMLNKEIDDNSLMLTDDQIVILFDLFKNSACFFNIDTAKSDNFLPSKTKEFCKKSNIDYELFKMLVSFGLVKKDNKFVPISYSQMIKIHSIIGGKSFNEQQFNEIVDTFGINTIMQKKNKDISTIFNKLDETKIEKMLLSEMNKFENIEYAKFMEKIITEKFDLVEKVIAVSISDINVLVSFYGNKEINYDFEDVFVKADEYERFEVMFNAKDLNYTEIIEMIDNYVVEIKKRTKGYTVK